MSADIDKVLDEQFAQTCAKLGLVPTPDLRTSVFAALAKGVTPAVVLRHWVTLTRPPLTRRRRKGKDDEKA